MLGAGVSLTNRLLGERTKFICSVLKLINALIGHPDLRDRVALRSEFVKLKLLEVFSLLSGETNVYVVRQLEIFESEMQEDDNELAELTSTRTPDEAEDPLEHNTADGSEGSGGEDSAPCGAEGRVRTMSVSSASVP